MRVTHRRTLVGSFCGLLLLGPALAWAMFAMPAQAPVDRLVRNIGAYVQENPRDPSGHYLLGRVHYLAMAHKRETVGVFERGGRGPGANLPQIAEDHLQGGFGRPGQPAPPAPADDVLAGHLASAIESFRTALKLGGKNPLYHLGLASAMDQGADLGWLLSRTRGLPPGDPAPRTQPADDQEQQDLAKVIRLLGDPQESVRNAARKDLLARGAVAVPLLWRQANAGQGDAPLAAACRGAIAAYWREQAIPVYRQAYRLSFDKDVQLQHRPIEGLQGLVSYEAGQAYVRLVESRPASAAERTDLAQVKQGLAQLDAKPFGAITPVVFSLGPAAPLADLLAPRTTVAFDLDGTGRPQHWNWLKPAAGLLVWDPDRSGRITSGRQLFGSVTWWLFFPDGYRALDALDDNRDHRLSGAELDGLSVWFDRNSDGVSDAGEVVPVSGLGIESLGTRPTGADGPSPMAVDGVRLRDGRVLPSYDWIAQPVQPQP